MAYDVREKGNCVDKGELEADARSYARSVIEEYDLPIDLSQVEFVASGRLKKSHANVREGQIAKLSWDAHQNHGWENTKQNVRWCLGVIVSMNENYSEFEKSNLLEELDANHTVTESASPPEYLVVCENCRAKYERQRKSKLVKNPQSYQCGVCKEQSLVRKE